MTIPESLGLLLVVTICLSAPVVGAVYVFRMIAGWIHTPLMGEALVRTGGLTERSEGYRTKTVDPVSVCRGGRIMVMPFLHKITRVSMESVTTNWKSTIPDRISTASPVSGRDITIFATVQVEDTTGSIKAAARRLSPQGSVDSRSIHNAIPLERVSREVLWNYDESKEPAQVASEIEDELRHSIEPLGLSVTDTRVVINVHVQPQTIIEPTEPTTSPRP